MVVRLVRFGAVGTLCLLIQIFILFILEHFIPPIVANGIGFVVSAQLNFILSYRVTWRDSARKKGVQLVAKWIQFNLVVLLSAAINAAAFGLIRYALIELNLVAAIGATIISTACTFLINHYVVLKPEGVDHDHKTRNSNVPASVE
jgi:putative flippase GtrA